MTVITQLAEFVTEAEIDIDDGVRATVRSALIDTLGCILLGAREPVARQAYDTLAGWGAGPCAVFGTGLKLAPPWAAMANAVAGHALDFDDWELPGNTHPSVVLFPALLAMAAERPTPGRAILEAYAVGFEVIARLGVALNFEHYDRGWHSTATLGPMAAAAALARLLGLDREKTAHALSIAVSQASGYTCQFGSDAKPLQAGFAAKAGVLAAGLAKAGMTGQSHVLDGPSGFNVLTAHGDAARFAAAFKRLGDPLALKEFGVAFKAYPSCGYTHRLVDCALDLRARPGFSSDDIVEITACLLETHARILPFHQPESRSEALFSGPYCVALALARGRVAPADFDGAPWQAPSIRRLTAMVKLETRQPKNPALNLDQDDPDWLLVKTSDGKLQRAECAFPLGAPQNPMPYEQILAKFVANAGAEGLAQLRTWDQVAEIGSILQNFEG